MSGYMVTGTLGGVQGFYMVNSDDPKEACAQVVRCTGGKTATALTVLSDETLAYHKVKPNEPWLCFATDGNREPRVIGSSFNEGDLEYVGGGEIRWGFNG